MFAKRQEQVVSKRTPEVNVFPPICIQLTVGVSSAPLFESSCILVIIPKILNEVVEFLWCPDFFETNIRVVGHGLGLPQRHGHTSLFVANTSLTLRTKLLDTTVHIVLVKFRSISKRLDGHVLVLLWCGVVFGVKANDVGTIKVSE